MPSWAGLVFSVGEVWSGPVPGHFCQTRDQTVQSLTKILGPGPGLPWTVYIGLVPVQTQSRPGPCMFGATGAAPVAYWGSSVHQAHGHESARVRAARVQPGHTKERMGHGCMGKANGGP